MRWRITGREMLTHLNEYCDVGVSVRGIYIPSGKSGAAVAAAESADERPLYLCLEANNERSIQMAKTEIMRIIKEELIKLVSLLNHALLLVASISLGKVEPLAFLLSISKGSFKASWGKVLLAEVFRCILGISFYIRWRSGESAHLSSQRSQNQCSSMHIQ